jgi:carbonic anhydrase
MPELRRLGQRAGLVDDAWAGLGAASLTLPLALFVAADAGLPPIQALVTAVVAGILGALFGGSRLTSDGPALAATTALSLLATGHGPVAVEVACLIAGALQLVVGVLGLGRFAHLVPIGVAHGFVLGLGAYLALHALPHALGLPTPPDLTPVQILDHLGSDIGQASGPALTLGALTLVCGGAAVLRWPRVPVVLGVLLCGTMIQWVVGLDVPTLSHESALVMPSFGLPFLPRSEIAAIFGLSITIAIVTSLETLLSSHATRLVDDEQRVDPNQDLIANGLSCLVLAFMGGMPASASIARGAALSRGRPATRRAGLVVALISAGVGVVLLLVAPHVPLGVVGTSVLLVALPLIDPRPLLRLFRQARVEGTVALVTAVTTTFVGLVEGVGVGVVLTLAVAAVNVARARSTIHAGRDGRPTQVSLSGPLTFLAAPMLHDLSTRVDDLAKGSGLIVDLRSVTFVDGTGAARLVAIAAGHLARGGKVALLGVSASCRDALVRADAEGRLEGSFAIADKDVDTILGVAGAFHAQAHVMAGLERFRSEMREHYTPLFDQLADGQSPHTLLVTCVDSRIQPELLTGAHPGELFIVRSLGGLVSPVAEGNLPNEAAAVEYAVGVLGVRNVVVCGHSKCGAIKALMSGQAPTELEALQRWMLKAEAASGDLTGFADADEAAKAATARQLENLRSIPQVREREQKGELELRAWFYDVGHAEVFEWDSKRQRYAIAGLETRASLRPSARPSEHLPDPV